MECGAHSSSACYRGFAAGTQDGHAPARLERSNPWAALGRRWTLGVYPTDRSCYLTVFPVLSSATNRPREGICTLGRVVASITAVRSIMPFSARTNATAP